MYLIPQFVTLDELGPELNVLVRKSSRAKRYSIRIKQGIAELVLPNNNLKAGYLFLQKTESWIRKKLLQSNARIALMDHNQLPIWGKKYILQNIEAPHRKVLIKDNYLQVYSPALKEQSTLIGFLRKILLKQIDDYAEVLSKALSTSFTKIRITNSRSNWGSCSSRGTLSFNWRLILAPKEILHYVVVHELCHRIEMNHSLRFWQLVEMLCPDYKAHRSWLKENGPLLRHYMHDGA